MAQSPCSADLSPQRTPGTTSIARRERLKRIQKVANEYRQGRPPFIFTASLRGPFDQSWTNPWKTPPVTGISSSIDGRHDGSRGSIGEPRDGFQVNDSRRHTLHPQLSGEIAPDPVTPRLTEQRSFVPATGKVPETNTRASKASMTSDSTTPNLIKRSSSVGHGPSVSSLQSSPDSSNASAGRPIENRILPLVREEPLSPTTSRASRKRKVSEAGFPEHDDPRSSQKHQHSPARQESPRHGLSQGEETIVATQSSHDQPPSHTPVLDRGTSGRPQSFTKDCRDSNLPMESGPNPNRNLDGLDGVFSKKSRVDVNTEGGHTETQSADSMDDTALQDILADAQRCLKPWNLKDEIANCLAQEKNRHTDLAAPD